MIEIEKKNVCGDCQVVWQERIFHSWCDEEQRKNSCFFLLHRKMQKVTATARDKALMKVENVLNFLFITLFYYFI